MTRFTTGLRLVSLSVLCVAFMAPIAVSVAGAASSPKPGVGPGGLTSARLCSFVTSVQAQGLLRGATPDGPGYPNTDNPGNADCTWATNSGDNTSLSVSPNPGIKGCNGAKGKVLHFAGTTGCLPKTVVGMEVGKGKYYLEFTSNGVDASAKLTSTMEKVAAQVFMKLHA